MNGIATDELEFVFFSHRCVALWQDTTLSHRPLDRPFGSVPKQSFQLVQLNIMPLSYVANTLLLRHNHPQKLLVKSMVENFGGLFWLQNYKIMQWLYYFEIVLKLLV